MKTTIKLVERESLTPVQTSLMWDIYKGFYDYTYESFMERIETNTLYALYLKGDKICGFTGLRINHLNVDGKTQFLIYFGQTILPGGLKGKHLFPLTTAKLVLKYWKKILFSSTWVWFDALTFKAYWIPAKVTSDFYPNHAVSTPPFVKNIMSNIGRFYYGDSYCEKTHVVTKPKLFVKLAYRAIPQEFMSNADVAFYAASNPGYQEGHGLLTMIPMNLGNIAIVLGYFLKKRTAQKSGLEHRQIQPVKTILQHENKGNNLSALADTHAVGVCAVQ